MFGLRALLASAILIAGCVSSSEIQCPELPELAEVSDDNDEGLYLNLQSPAGCNGTVTAWRYCYHTKDRNRNRIYSAQFAVYRPVYNGYTRVVGSCTTITKYGHEEVDHPFHCESLRLEPSEQFVVNSWDVIGVCLTNGGPTRQLLVISELEDDTPSSLDNHTPSGHGLASVNYVTSMCSCGIIGTYNSAYLIPQDDLLVHVALEVDTMDEDAGRDGASSKMNTMDGDGMEREETIGEKSVEGSGSREVGYFTTATGHGMTSTMDDQITLSSAENYPPLSTHTLTRSQLLHSQTTVESASFSLKAHSSTGVPESISIHQNGLDSSMATSIIATGLLVPTLVVGVSMAIAILVVMKRSRRRRKKGETEQTPANREVDTSAGQSSHAMSNSTDVGQPEAYNSTTVSSLYQDHMTRNHSFPATDPCPTYEFIELSGSSERLMEPSSDDCSASAAVSHYEFDTAFRKEDYQKLTRPHPYPEDCQLPDGLYSSIDHAAMRDPVDRGGPQ